MRIRSVLSHSIQAVLEGALLAMIVVGLIAGTAFAAKGGGKPAGGGSSTLNLVLLDSTDGVANYGERITFEVATTATDKPSVKVACTQAGTVVYRSSAGFYPDYPWPWAQTFSLSSTAWTGGAADCTATLYYYNGKSYPTLATRTFHVDA